MDPNNAPSPSSQMNENALQGTRSISFPDGNKLRRGPVFVALGDDNAILGIEAVNTLTTLGALNTLCKTKEKYKSATVIATGFVNVSENGYGEGEPLRVLAPDTEEEHLWWNELLLWDQHGNRLKE